MNNIKRSKGRERVKRHEKDEGKEQGGKKMMVRG